MMLSNHKNQLDEHLVFSWTWLIKTMNPTGQNSRSLSASRVDGLRVDYWALTFDFTFSPLSRLRQKSLATLKRKPRVLKCTSACSVGTKLDLFASHSPLDILTPTYDGFTCCLPCTSSADDYHLLFSPPKPPPHLSAGWGLAPPRLAEEQHSL